MESRAWSTKRSSPQRRNEPGPWLSLVEVSLMAASYPYPWIYWLLLVFHTFVRIWTKLFHLGDSQAEYRLEICWIKDFSNEQRILEDALTWVSIVLGLLRDLRGVQKDGNSHKWVHLAKKGFNVLHGCTLSFSRFLFPGGWGDFTVCQSIFSYKNEFLMVPGSSTMRLFYFPWLLCEDNK